ncbi:CRISPR-associated endonuclease Cas1 [Streptomyces iranensis]|uniref:CRISPR-associated endonuclease Cas1 n=1 Tax=Streptomyces iranensis TaxID=576784 RepID=UPI0039B78779
MVVDGYGVTINVNRGHLVITDGIGSKRRTRKIPKVERTVRRIIIQDARGTLSLDAVDWCESVGISVIYTDSEGKPRLSSTPASGDAKLRRAQAFAGNGGPYENTGLHVVKEILGRKLGGQAANLRAMGHHKAADEIEDCARSVSESPTVDLCRSFEGQAGAAYWNAWIGTVGVPWSKADASKVPSYWEVYVSRSSLTSGRQRGATDPVNAMLNYCYRLAEIECVLACHAAGLDPTFGILHLDNGTRNSFALDLLETIRPEIERYVLGLIGALDNQPRTFHRSEFTETRDGQCRLNAPLTHELAEQTVSWARTLAPIVKEYALTFASVAAGSVTVGDPAKDKTLMREPARKPAPRKTERSTTPQRTQCVPIPNAAHDIVPPDLWEQVARTLPQPRQLNKADQRLSKHGVLAGAVCTELLSIPGRHLPATLADRKTVRTHLQRWKADGTWGTLVPLLTAHPRIRTLMGAGTSSA